MAVAGMIDDRFGASTQQLAGLIWPRRTAATLKEGDSVVFYIEWSNALICPWKGAKQRLLHSA